MIQEKAREHCDKLGISAYAVENIIKDVIQRKNYEFYKVWKSKYGKTRVYKGQVYRKGKLCTIYFFMRKSENLLDVFVIGIHETTSKRARR